MDQGIIRNLKLNIYDYIYKDLIHKIDNTPFNENESNPNPMLEFYQKLNIYDAIKYVGKGWEKVKKSTMINCWHKGLDLSQLEGLTPYKDLIPIPKKK